MPQRGPQNALLFAMTEAEEGTAGKQAGQRRSRTASRGRKAASAGLPSRARLLLRVGCRERRKTSARASNGEILPAAKAAPGVRSTVCCGRSIPCLAAEGPLFYFMGPWGLWPFSRRALERCWLLCDPAGCKPEASPGPVSSGSRPCALPCCLSPGGKDWLSGSGSMDVDSWVPCAWVRDCVQGGRVAPQGVRDPESELRRCAALVLPSSSFLPSGAL